MGAITSSPTPILIGSDGWGCDWIGAIDDVRIYNHGLTWDEIAAICPPPRVAKNPTPADGAVGVQAPLFKWEAGYAGVMHEVYFGTTPDLGPANLVQPRTPTMMYWHLPGIQPGVTYYWRVDEVEKDGVTVNTGNVWSFTTQALTAYLPSPKDGATDASPATALSWQPGQGVVKHHVYFGVNRDAVTQGTAATDKGEIAEATFAPGALDSVTTYYWRVDELPAGGGTSGPARSGRSPRTCRSMILRATPTTKAAGSIRPGSTAMPTRAAARPSATSIPRSPSRRSSTAACNPCLWTTTTSMSPFFSEADAGIRPRRGLDGRRRQHAGPARPRRREQQGRPAVRHRRGFLQAQPRPWFIPTRRS